MEKVRKHALGYVISMVVILVLVASYFFMKMGESLNAGQVGVSTLKDENNALIQQSKQLNASIAQFKIKVSELEQTVAEKHAALTDRQGSTKQPDPAVICAAYPSPDSVATLQSQLEDSQLTAAACATTVAEQSADIDALKTEAQSLDKAESELRTANKALQALRSELTQTRQHNERLLQASRQKNRNEGAGREDKDTANVTEARLSQANQDIARLQARVQQLQNENDELTASSRSTGSLDIIEFQAQPVFCRTQFAQDRICLASIDITATFNYSPSGFITLIVVDPSGATIGRESIAGRAVNRVTFELDEEKPALTGEYHIEFRVKDVFTRFSNTQRFMITAT